MRTLLGLSALLATLSGCIVVTPRHHVYRPRPVPARVHVHGAAPVAAPRTCPPAYHWNGYSCVHNGNAYGRR